MRESATNITDPEKIGMVKLSLVLNGISSIPIAAIAPLKGKRVGSEFFWIYNQ